MTMITPSYLGETIEYSSLHACRSTLEDPTVAFSEGIPCSFCEATAFLRSRNHLRREASDMLIPRYSIDASWDRSAASARGFRRDIETTVRLA